VDARGDQQPRDMFVPEPLTLEVSGNAPSSKALRIAFVPPGEIKPPAIGISDHYANDHSQCDRQHWILFKVFQTSVLYGIFVFHIES
jgi:hypothetical protein